MLLSSSTGLPNSIISHLFSILHTGSQLKKGLISNSLQFPLNLWMALPLPTSQIFFTFTLLGSSVILQTPECSEYSPAFRTKSNGQHSFSYQARTTWNKLPASIRHASSVSSFKSSLKTFLLSKSFSSVPLPLGACVSRGVSVCLCVCVCVCVSVSVSLCVKFVSA